MNKEKRLRDKQLRKEAGCRKKKKERKKEQEAGNFFVVRGNPWSRNLLRVKRRDKNVETKTRKMI